MAEPAAFTAETVEAAMLCMKGTDNAVIGHASAYLKALLAAPDCGPLLYGLLTSSSHVIVRQLSGVLLRPKAIAMWNRMPPASREVLKASLLARLAEEPARSVRRAVISLVASLAKALLPTGNWPEVVTTLEAATTSADAELREAGFVLMRELQESLASRFSPLLDTVAPWIGAALADGNARVRRAALRCLGLLLLTTTAADKLERLQAMLPAMVEVAQQCIEARVDEPVVETLDTLRSLIEGDSAIIHPYVVPLAHFFMAIMTSDALEDDTKAEASECIIALLEVKWRTLLKKGVVDGLIPIILEGMARYDPAEERDSYREAREAGIEVTEICTSFPWQYCGRVLDAMAVYVPAHQVFRRVSAFVGPWLTDADAARRQAALNAIGLLAEGCAHVVDEHLDMLLEVVVRAADDDPAPMVQEAAMYALACFAEFVQPNVLDHHDVIIPAVLRMLARTTQDTIVERACNALENLVDSMDPDAVALYIEPMMTKIGELLVTWGADYVVTEVIVGAIASVAASASHHLRPFLEPIAAAMAPLVALTDERQLRLRSAATETLGFTAVAVGRDAFRAFLPDLMATVHSGLAFDNMELAEKTFVFYGSMAETFGEELAPYVPTIVPELLQWLTADDVMRVSSLYDDDDAAEGLSDLGGETDDDDDDDGADGDGDAAGGAGDDGDDGDDGGAPEAAPDGTTAPDNVDADGNIIETGAVETGAHMRMRVHTAALEMKQAAAVALGFLAQHAPVAFAPYLGDTMKLMGGLAGHFDTTLAQRAITGLVNCLHAMVVHAPLIVRDGEPPLFQESVQVAFNDIVTGMLEKLRATHNVRLACTLCAALQQLIKNFGAAALVSHHAAIMKQVIKIGREKAACQLVADDGEGGAVMHRNDAADIGEAEETLEETIAGSGGGGGGAAAGGGDDDVDHDELVVEATEVVVAAAHAMGDTFNLYLPAVLRAWRHFLKPSRPAADHQMVIGMWADLAQAMGAAFAPNVEFLLPTVLQAAASDNRDIRRNAMFAIGCMLEAAPDACRPHLSEALAAMHAVVTLPRTRHADNPLIDNAAAAVARAIIALPDAVPLPLALPPLMAQLPLRQDREEDATIFRCLMPLLQAANEELLKHLPQLAALLGYALRPGNRTPPAVIASHIYPALHAFMLSAPPASKDAFGAAVAALPDAERDAVVAMCS